MKKPLYKFAYRTVSRLSDLTGGLAFIVRWKVALAAVVLGFSVGTVTTSCKPMCYDQPAEPTCYDPVPSCYVAPAPDPDEGGGGGEASAEFTEQAPETPSEATAE